ncbi:MAG: hypothetical protein U9Q40_00425 [Campylobacterota bacterium]|nr:hypothetical protein [Campylobacterota bacterium]
MSLKKEQVYTLLKGIETGDPKAVVVVNEAKYIQHNPLTQTGNVGLAKLFKRLSETNPHVEIVRLFQDGDYVFAHTDYDFNILEVGFELFRFEDAYIVEHWDNLQLKPEKANPSGHTMLDGLTEVSDLEKTQENKKFVASFVNDVLVNNHLESLDNYIDKHSYIEHNKDMSDGIEKLHESLSLNKQNREYVRVHKVLGEGNFVLSIIEGYLDGVHTSFYDLFLIKNKLIIEHWDTVNEIPPKSQWVNSNGKFNFE